jgi:hypothetical protein
MRSRRRGPHQAERATWFRPHQTESWRPWDPEKLRETPLRRLIEGYEVECSVYVDKDETNLVHEEWDFGTFVNGKNDVHIAMHYDFSFSRQFATAWNVFVLICEQYHRILKQMITQILSMLSSSFCGKFTATKQSGSCWIQLSS